MITVKQLSYSYSKWDRPLFDKVNIEIAAGSIYGILGDNGSGKSTLLKILTGLIKPQSGYCQVFDAIPSDREPNFLSDIFLLPEEIFVPTISAIAYGNRFSKFYPKFSQDQFTELLGEFDLSENEILTRLSLGQKKKFLLAFGLATNTRLLIMDEPSNGLDLSSKNQFRSVLLSHFAEDRSFIISTHQTYDLEGLIDSVIILSDGKLVLQQKMDLLHSRLTQTVELSTPSDALYFEKTMEGFTVIRKNKSSEETYINLALLYNFVIAQPEKVNSLFPLSNDQ